MYLLDTNHCSSPDILGQPPRVKFDAAFENLWQKKSKLLDFKLTNILVEIIILMMTNKNDDKETNGKLEINTSHDSTVQKFLQEIDTAGDYSIIQKN